MTREEALKAWEQMYSEIDKDNWLFVGTINPQMAEWAIKALSDRKDENSSEKPNNCGEQTYVINPQEPTNDDKCFECDDFFTCGGQCNKIEDEPQTYITEDRDTQILDAWQVKQMDCPWK